MENIIILAIETSCDDTCIAILKIKNQKSKILSNAVSSQIEIHKRYGGVYPMMAKREHQKNLPLVLKKSLEEAKINRPDYIAVTIGPGLEPCLWTGVNFAKHLAQKWNLEIIPVNHIESHILVNFLQTTNHKLQAVLPAVCLVVSGGHTQLILMKEIGKYKILGETRDDAAGECFDKTARILGLDYPGGPAVAQQADQFRQSRKNKETSKLTIVSLLPRPMIYSKDYDFSFSGLKTAVLYKVKCPVFAKASVDKEKQKTKKFVQMMAKEIQQAIIDILIKKTLKAAKDYNAKTIILGGGVSANQELRKQFKKKIQKDFSQCQFLVPEPKFSTDNAVMTAITAYFNLSKTQSWKKIKVNANLKV